MLWCYYLNSYTNLSYSKMVLKWSINLYIRFPIIHFFINTNQPSKASDKVEMKP